MSLYPRPYPDSGSDGGMTAGGRLARGSVYPVQVSEIGEQHDRS